MPGLDIEIPIDQGRRQFFGEHVKNQYSLMLQVVEHFLTPRQDAGGCRGSIEFASRQDGWFRCFKQRPVAEQYAERQMSSDLGAQVSLDLKAVHFVDQVSDEHDQGPFAEMRGQMQKRQVVPRFHQLREAVE